MAGADMGFVRFETKIEIPIEAVDEEIDGIVGTTSWQDALTRLVGVDPRPDELRAIDRGRSNC